jgi:hypothetical protein
MVVERGFIFSGHDPIKHGGLENADIFSVWRRIVVHSYSKKCWKVVTNISKKKPSLKTRYLEKRSPKTNGTDTRLVTTVKLVPFLHEIFARGENKNRTLCNEDTAGCVLLEDQSFT